MRRLAFQSAVSPLLMNALRIWQLRQQKNCSPRISADPKKLISSYSPPKHRIIVLPATACLLQDRLGLPMTVGALDYSLGCSGYVYGLATAKGLIESGMTRNVLLLTGETYSKIINPTDKSVRTLFSDGGAATLITGIEGEEDHIGPFIFGTDGRGAEKLIVPAGGARNKPSAETNIPKDCGEGLWRSPEELFMDGPEIFNFSLREVPLAVRQLLEKSRTKLEEVDYFVFHQASKFMLDQLRKKLKIPEEKFGIQLETVGNTVSSSIPIALDMFRQEKKIKNGDTIMLVGFGVGYSWGATLIKVIFDT